MLQQEKKKKTTKITKFSSIFQNWDFYLGVLSYGACVLFLNNISHLIGRRGYIFLKTHMSLLASEPERNNHAIRQTKPQQGTLLELFDVLASFVGIFVFILFGFIFKV